MSTRRTRWTRDDWIAHAAERLKQDGPPALTLDALCATANRTRGSFYHHFDSVDALLLALAHRWRETETEAVAARVADVADGLEGLALMTRLTDAIDAELERGMRMLAMTNEAARDAAEAVDARREAVMRDLLRTAYRLGEEEAASAARLFHALHQTAVMRSPADIRGYTRPAIRSLVGWIAGERRA